MLPPRIKHESGRKDEGKRCPAHRAWVRLHACCACGSTQAIECAHVRSGTQGGMGMKPSDKWCISLCENCHATQHQIGEDAFERHRRINMKALAEEFFRKSPHRHKLMVGQ